MKLNFSFKNNFKNRLYVYLANFGLLSLLLIACVTIKTNPKDYEKFGIFIGAEGLNKIGLKEIVSNELKEDLVINIETVSENDELFQKELNSSGRTADLIILSKTIMDNEDYLPYAIIPDSSKYYSNTNLIEIERRIGIQVNEQENCFLSNYVTLNNEPYYVMINEDTVHGKEFFDEYKTNQIERVLDVFLNIV